MPKFFFVGESATTVLLNPNASEVLPILRQANVPNEHQQAVFDKLKSGDVYATDNAIMVDTDDSDADVSTPPT